MKGQAKALIPALIGIAILLTGITGIRVLSGEQQVVQTAKTRSGKAGLDSRQDLAKAFRSSADEAALQMGADVAADLTVDLKNGPTLRIAMADSE